MTVFSDWIAGLDQNGDFDLAAELHQCVFDAGLEAAEDIALLDTAIPLPDVKCVLVLGSLEHRCVPLLRLAHARARGALDGTIAMLSRQLSKPPPPSSASGTASATVPVVLHGDAVKSSKRFAALEGRVVKAALGIEPRSRYSDSAAAASLKQDVRDDFANVLAECWCLWHSFGSLCLRATEMASSGLSQEVSKALQEDVFKASFRSADGLQQMVRSFRVLMLGVETYTWNLWGLSEWQVAALLKDQHNCGRTRCVRMFRACIWAEKSFGVNLHTSSPLVQGQRSLPLDAATSLPPPRPARMAPLEFVAAMEALTMDGLTLPMRCWAGAFCALSHGVLRWSDFQRSENLILTSDAVTATSWRMKKKITSVPWAALRVGVSGRDWGRAWVDAMAECGLPAVDFLLFASDGALQRFSESPAR